MTHKRLISTLTLTFCLLFSVVAQIPTGYYNAANGLTGFPLKTALYNIIKGHTIISYDNLYDKYIKTDVIPPNTVWDMYSHNPTGTTAYTYTYGTGDECGSYNSEGDCFNREHSVPASWFNDASPTYSDLFVVYPTDGYVNNIRSNYPFGEVLSPTFTSTNGSKRGSCSYPGYSGTVFEPIDAYKGDFARTLFYLATRYENTIATWYSNTAEAANALVANNTVCFQTWHLNMLYEWHVSDPVSAKEIARNDSVYKIQHNRNPYIDHPEWVAVIWNMPTTAANFDLSEKIRIFPNPADDAMQISIPDISSTYQITITDITGRMISQIVMSTENQMVDISMLTKGMYLLVLENNNTRIVKNFIKN